MSKNKICDGASFGGGVVGPSLGVASNHAARFVLQPRRPRDHERLTTVLVFGQFPARFLPPLHYSTATSLIQSTHNPVTTPYTSHNPSSLAADLLPSLHPSIQYKPQTNRLPIYRSSPLLRVSPKRHLVPAPLLSRHQPAPIHNTLFCGLHCSFIHHQHHASTLASATLIPITYLLC